jgi:hypothetical protein
MICYDFPGIGVDGVIRTYHLAKQLPSFGWGQSFSRSTLLHRPGGDIETSDGHLNLKVTITPSRLLCRFKVIIAQCASQWMDWLRKTTTSSSGWFGLQVNLQCLMENWLVGSGCSVALRVAGLSHRCAFPFLRDRLHILSPIG